MVLIQKHSIYRVTCSMHTLVKCCYMPFFIVTPCRDLLLAIDVTWSVRLDVCFLVNYIQQFAHWFNQSKNSIYRVTCSIAHLIYMLKHAVFHWNTLYRPTSKWCHVMCKALDVCFLVNDIQQFAHWFNQSKNSLYTELRMQHTQWMRNIHGLC